MIVADSWVPENKKKISRETIFKKCRFKKPVEVCQAGDDFSTCANQLRQGEIQKKLLGPGKKIILYRLIVIKIGDLSMSVEPLMMFPRWHQTSKPQRSPALLLIWMRNREQQQQQ